MDEIKTTDEVKATEKAAPKVREVAKVIEDNGSFIFAKVQDEAGNIDAKGTDKVEKMLVRILNGEETKYPKVRAVHVNVLAKTGVDYLEISKAQAIRFIQSKKDFWEEYQAIQEESDGQFDIFIRSAEQD